MRDLFGLKFIRFLLVPRRNDIELFNQLADIRNQNGILLNVVVGLKSQFVYYNLCAPVSKFLSDKKYYFSNQIFSNRHS